ncbi:hypothetical protein V8C44DRAFT_112999 [Trichoderma aethiopicum]
MRAACPENRLQFRGCNKQFSLRQSHVTTPTRLSLLQPRQVPDCTPANEHPKTRQGVEMPSRHRSPLARRCPGIRACRGTFCSGDESS